MKLGKKSVRGAVAATAVAIGATALAATPAFAWGTSGWLSTNAIVTVDGCGVYSSMGYSSGRPNSEASETYVCRGVVQSVLQYQDMSASYFQEFGPWGDKYSSATAFSFLWISKNHKANHNH